MRVWIRWLLVGAVVVVGAAATAGRSGHGEASAAQDAAVLLSGQLVAAPSVPLDGEPELDGPRAAALAADASTRVPLPAGGNFDGIRWGELDGTIGAAQVEEVVQYNAACQWYRALRDGRDVADARRVIADIPGWQALRGHATGELAAAVAADVAAGGGDALTGVLRQCNEAHEREIAYARAGGTAGER